ncbi:MAG: polyphosphate kinase 2 [Mesorhizobium sp. SCN 65-20]|nr:MAG: polyphosphate kinase 2 [Mesorhizobium sp. SCN 65-20]
MGKGKDKKKKNKKSENAAVAAAEGGPAVQSDEMPKESYNKKLEQLQVELAHLQAWVKHSGAKIVIIFEGRDAAGKGGVIKRLTERLSPRVFRVVALPAPTEREKSQMYFQRYMAHLPAAGEVVIFDRSWYNRPGVERVMGFSTEAMAERFLRLAPHVEASLVDSGIRLLKYFLDVSEEEQEKRFRQRIDDPMRQWKLSPMDVESYRRWWDYTRAYNEMITATDTRHAPWWIVPSDDKKRARINCISHILSSIPYEKVPFDEPKLGHRQKRPGDFEADTTPRNVVPDVY